ncbi:MAG: hypothetical protein CMN30_33575 [Sandaracinus sp.]|nr:hypothetical protein [Sandaracinus sp.]|tara:strand:- start:1857 stop:2819 length:963 start_codon:yes stop_codon:yes gene_type:complete
MTRHVPTLALSLCTLALALVTTGCETVGWEIDDGFDGAERVFAAPGTYTLTLDSPGCRYGMLDLACENHSTELPADAAIEASIDDPAIASLAGPPSREVSWDPYTLPLIIHQPGRFALTVRDRDSGYQQTFDLEARGVDRIELEHPGAVALEGATLCVKGDLVGAEGEVLHSRLAWTLHADSDWPQSIDPDPSRPRQQSCLPELPAGQYWFSATYDGVVAEQTFDVVAPEAIARQVVRVNGEEVATDAPLVLPSLEPFTVEVDFALADGRPLGGLHDEVLAFGALDVAAHDDTAVTIEPTDRGAGQVVLRDFFTLDITIE